MAAKKTSKARSKNTARKKPPVKRAKSAPTSKTRPRKKKIPTAGRASRAPAKTRASGTGIKGLRVRMYRVGFGDFFLLTVPTAAGPKHILIDCGVHQGDAGTIKDAVDQMADETGANLALVIVTHRHADHISGFAKCKDAFAKFNVERVWMPWFENPKKPAAVSFQSNLMAVAQQLHLALAARTDPESQDLIYMTGNATGEPMPLTGKPGNSAALDVLRTGLKNTPAIDYYKAGDQPTLPQDLVEAGFEAQILGPPIDSGLISQMDNKNHQYLTGNEHMDMRPVLPFDMYRVSGDNYAWDALSPWKQSDIESWVKSAQPDLLAAKARQVDNTINNQSLVTLFKFRGKTLLFVGDAQWGNWENFLFGGAFGSPHHTDMTDMSKSILGAVDFYKVGHHGSTNANPIDAVNALRDGCIAMCSTEPGVYGRAKSGTEVPRAPLLDALQKKTNNQLVRSDQIPVPKKKPSSGLGPVPPVFSTHEGELFVDYNF